MPVRMERDEEDTSGGSFGGGGGGGGGGGWGIFALLTLAFRYPKLAIGILVILGVVYFCSRSGGGSTSNSNSSQPAAGGTGQTHAPGGKGLGCQLNQQEFDKALVFEPLVAGSLPRSASLLQYAPRPGDQGHQGSCVAWASAYGARTIQEAVATGKDPNQLAFSPAYLYNRMAGGNCDGTFVRNALELERQEGLVPLSEFPYNDQDCSSQPPNALREEASRYRIPGYNRLTKSGDDYKVDLTAIKQNIAQGAPVVVGMLVGGSFFELKGQKLWEPTESDYSALRGGGGGRIVHGGASDFGGHALCLIGYDDDYAGGAVQLLNSWGSNWGDKGTFWMRYKDFEQFTNTLGGEVYGLYPIASLKRAEANANFKASVGLVSGKQLHYIPVKAGAGATFSTSQVLAKGTTFRISVTNSIECYTYVFGQEANGSSYVLFPYTPKHSAYCGIVGQRVFPKDYHMKLDTLGNKDYMAVLLTKQELDYKALNDKVSQASGVSYEAKLRQALGNLLVQQVAYKPGEAVQFELPKSDQNQAVLVVFEINKR